MFTMEPELRPNSALYVELSILNSATVLIVGWKVIWFLHLVTQIDAVNHEIDGVLAIAGGDERKRPLPAQRSRQEAVCRRRDGAGDEQRQVHKVAPIERNLLHHVLIDDLANAHGRRFNHRLGAFDGHHGSGAGDLQAKILHGVLAKPPE